MSTKSLLMKNNKYLVAIVLFCVLLGDLGRIPLGSNLFISLLDVSVAVYIALVIMPILHSKEPLLKTYLTWTVFIFIIMINSLLFRSASLPIKEIAIAGLYPIRWFLYALIPLGIVITVQSQELSQIQLLSWLHKTVIYLALLGFLQLIFFPNLGIIQQFGFDPHYLRLVGTWLDPNFIGLAFILGLLVVESTLASSSRKYVVMVALFLALLATFSRSSYLGFAISGLIYALFQRSWQKAGMVLGAILVLYLSFAIPRQNLEKSRNIDRVVSAGSRLQSYSQGIQLFEMHPLFGIGYNLIRFEKKQLGMLDPSGGGNSGAGIDSSWILVLATMGTIGLLTYLCYWIRLFYLLIEPGISAKTKMFHSILYSLVHASPLEHAAAAFAVGWSVHSWFVNSLFFTLLSTIWGIALGIVFVNKIQK